MTVKAPPRLVELANGLASAKRQESEAKDRRMEIESAIIALLDFKKPEGQESYEAKTENGSSAKIVLKQPITTTFDSDKWSDVKSKVSTKARKAVVPKYSLDTKLAKALEADAEERESWLVISSLLSRKPGKVSVEIKEVFVEADDQLSGLSDKFPDEENV